MSLTHVNPTGFSPIKIRPAALRDLRPLPRHRCRGYAGQPIAEEKFWKSEARA